MINALDDDQVTEEITEEADDQLTDNQADGETITQEETESPKKDNVQAAIQRARERENAAAAKARELEEKLSQVNSRLEEMELQGLDEAEQYRLKYEKSEQEKQALLEEKQVEEVKKSYRSYLSDQESAHPKAVKALRKLMDKDIYPVQGQNPAEFNANFEDFASEIEGTTNEVIRAASSNPAFNPPDEIDFNSLSPTEMRKILPIKEED